MKKYFFLNGMPRAGNTLLASILNQNPDIKTTANSLTMGLIKKANDLKSLNNKVNLKKMVNSTYLKITMSI